MSAAYSIYSHSHIWKPSPSSATWGVQRDCVFNEVKSVFAL